MMLKATHSVSIYEGDKEGEEKVIRFDITLKRGKVYTLQGPNQSGKSTIIKTLSGVYKHQNQTGVNISLDDIDIILKAPSDAILNGIVAVHQDDELIPSMSLRTQFRIRHAQPKWYILRNAKKWSYVANVIEFFLKIKFLSDLFSVRPPSIGSDQDVDKKAIDLLRFYSNGEENDYLGILDKLPKQLSGGAKAVARLVAAQLASKINVLLLDEVFRGIHHDVWPKILDSLKIWAKDNSVALLVVTHYEDELIRWQPDERLEIEQKNGYSRLRNVYPFGYDMLNAGIPLKNKNYPVYYEKMEFFIENIDCKYRAIFFVDRSVVSCSVYQDIYTRLKNKYGEDRVLEYVVYVGEKDKSYAFAQSLFLEISELLGRQDSCMVLVGGGVLLNLGAFMASLIYRGVEFYLVPTTVMSMADVAIGSKTSLNGMSDFAFKKHLIGTYSNPKAVYLDKKFLYSLSENEICIGLSECLKHALLQDSVLYENVLLLLCDLTLDSLWIDKIYEVIFHVIEMKSNILLQDPWEEKGLGYILQYGHLHAHSIERLTHFELPHGLAVYIGIMVDLLLAKKTNLFGGVLNAFRARKLHHTEPIKKLIDRSQNTDFKIDLEKAYHSEQKHQLLSEKGMYKILVVDSAGEFKDKNNEYLSKKVSDFSYEQISEAFSYVILSIQ